MMSWLLAMAATKVAAGAAASLLAGRAGLQEAVGAGGPAVSLHALWLVHDHDKHGVGSSLFAGRMAAAALAEVCDGAVG